MNRKRAPKKLREAVAKKIRKQQQLILEVFVDDQGNYTGSVPETHKHYKLRQLWKYVRFTLGLAVSAIVIVGGVLGFTVTLPFIGAVVVTFVGEYIVIKLGEKIIYKTTDTARAEKWLGNPDTSREID